MVPHCWQNSSQGYDNKQGSQRGADSAYLAHYTAFCATIMCYTASNFPGRLSVSLRTQLLKKHPQEEVL